MQPARQLDLPHDSLELTFSVGGGLAPERWGLPSAKSWVDRSSPLFVIRAGGQMFDSRDPAGTVQAVRVTDRREARHAAIAILYRDAELEVDLHIAVYPGTSLVEQWVTLRNAGETPLRVEHIDSVSLRLPRDDYELLHFSSAWGAEFESVRRPLEGAVCLESRSGRSSNGMHPFFALSHGDERFSGAIAWSGNWVIRLEPEPTCYRVSGGLHDWEFSTDLTLGMELECPHMILATAHGDLDQIAQQYHRVGRRHWYPQNDASRRLPVEWNHWWCYEDQKINESTFRANVDTAAQLGLDLCTLDAGWFGNSSAAAAWGDYRGDWDRVNEARFPSGIRSLADHTHEQGLLFGLWCEIEGLGKKAAVAQIHPEFQAIRDGAPLGYVCLGCPDAAEWALGTLERLTLEYRCDWIKLDFNVDPGAGCDRVDHGHSRGDGLFAHYRGYYRMLSRFRERHPAVTLENCSSGGLRIDLAMACQTHCTFLSDPDWPEHNLQVFWGASMMLAPEVCLHWSWSEWIQPHPHQTFDPRDPNLTQHTLDYAIRTALLGIPGFSLQLPDLPAWVSDRIAFHTRLYKEFIKRFVRDADLYRLTDQPKREGRGDRWCAFQYSLPDEHLLFVFRLPGGERRRTLVLRDLDPARVYQLSWIDDGREEYRLGSELIEQGLTVDSLDEEASAIVRIHEENRAT